ncbi:hypothetical protein [Luteolibacter soli]|uniref:DUF4412 domain-containing protein n=1 Tax=Luteolibacter soli TaxID=3135280 RepID=A0ABU9AX56_9BACT
MKWLCFAVIAGLCSGQAMAETTVITGVRTWHMTDGKSRRLKLIMLTPDGKHAYFSDGKNKGQIPAVAVESLVPEEREVLEGVHSGKVTLCKVEGLSMQLSWPTGKAPEYLVGLQAGEAREWKHVSGKAIQARLVNLTDDDVSLLVGETFSLVAIRDLSEADRQHLEKVKRGNVTVAFSGALELLNGGWDKGPSYSVSVSSERFAALGELGGDFQKALNASLKAAGEKLPEGKWKFISLSEYTCSRPNFAAADAKLPMLYEATFALEGTGVRAARDAWPLTVTPVQWPGDPELILHVTADGEILKAQRQ